MAGRARRGTELWSVRGDAASRLHTAWRVLGALRAQRLSRLIPLAVLLFAVAALLIASHAAGPLAPFIYPLF